MSDEKPVINITSHNQSGGITAHTVHIGKPAFELTEELLKQTLAAVPTGIPVDLTSVGGPRAHKMGEVMNQHLLAAGHYVVFTQCGVRSPPAETPIEVELTPTMTHVTIDPKA